MEAEPRRWAATYTKHVKQKRKAYHDGALLLHPASGRLVLLDDADDTVDSRFLRAGEAVSAGASIAFQSHLVDVGEPQTHSTSYSASSVAAPAVASRTAHRGGPGARPNAVNPHPPRAFVNPPMSCGGGCGKAEAAGPCGAEGADSRFQEWSALYTTNLTAKAKKYHDGVVRLVQVGLRAKQIVLLDEEGEVLGSRYLKLGESVESGKKCHFPNYLIEIGEAKNQSKGVEPNSSEAPMVQTRPKSGENTSNKMGSGATSKSMKFTDPEESKSEVTSSSNKPETGKIEVAAAGNTESLMGSTDLGFKEWSALYTTQLTQKAKKYHDGVIKFMQVGSHAKQIILLDEDGQVLGSRYLKSGESVESGTKCQLPNYLIEVCEPRNQKNDVEPKHSSEDALSHTGPKNGENTSDKMGGRSRSPKFVSPLKFHDLQKSKSGSTTGYNRPQVGKSKCTNVCDPLKFHVFADLQRGQSDCTVSYRRTDLGKPTFSNMDDPHKFHDFADIQRGKSDCAASYNWPEAGKSSSNRMDDPLEFHDFLNGKSGCSTSFIRREVGKSTFGNMDDNLRTASQILSIMKPPSEIRFFQSIPATQARSSSSSESKIMLDASHSKRASNMSVIDNSNRTVSGSMNSGLCHFAAQLRTSVQSCLKLETVEANNSVSTHHRNEPSRNDHQTIMRPAAFEGLELSMLDNLTFDMSNAKEKKLHSSSKHHTGNSNGSAPGMNVTTIPGLQEDKSGTADQPSAEAVDGKCGSGPFVPSNLTCRDPEIQRLIDDCPSFDLGF